MLILLFACTAAAPSDTGDTADTGVDTADTAPGETAETGDSDTAPPFAGLHLGLPVFTTVDDPTWADRAAAAAATGGWLVVDIAHGPGDGKDTAWATTLAAARAAGVPVVGNVEINLAAAEAGNVEVQLGRWSAWYKLDGVFLAATGAADCEAAAADLAVYAKYADDHDADGDAFVVVPVSAGGCEAMLSVADVLLSDVPVGSLAAEPVPAWRSAWPTERFALWVTGAAAGDVSPAMQTAVDSGFGTVYVTDGEAEASALPPYWVDELALITG